MSSKVSPDRAPNQTRQRLLAEAGAILDAEGQDGVTTRAVAARVGVTAMATYKHFSDKQALLVALATEDFKRLGSAMDEADPKRGPAKRRMARVMAAYVAFGISHPERYRLMFGREIHDAVSPELTEAAMGVYGRIETAIERCLAGQTPPEPSNALAGMVLACAHGAIDLHLTGHVTPVKGLGEPERMMQRLVSLLPI